MCTCTCGQVEEWIQQPRWADARTSPQKLEAYKEKGVQIFGSGEEMIASGAIDALLIATPHYQHTSLGVAALEAGLHIMVEKPISAHKADAERLIAAAAARPDQVFGAMFQLRVEPRYQKIRELVQGGELGDLVRVLWIMTDWFRSEAYFQSGGWRATWKGEGGGVLRSQYGFELVGEPASFSHRRPLPEAVLSNSMHARIAIWARDATLGVMANVGAIVRANDGSEAEQ